MTPVDKTDPKELYQRIDSGKKKAKKEKEKEGKKAKKKKNKKRENKTKNSRCSFHYMRWMQAGSSNAEYEWPSFRLVSDSGETQPNNGTLQPEQRKRNNKRRRGSF